jgi:hypothetical protein
MKELAGAFFVAVGLAGAAVDANTISQSPESYQKQFPSLSLPDASKVRTMERSHMVAEGLVDLMLIGTGLKLIKPSPQ